MFNCFQTYSTLVLVCATAAFAKNLATADSPFRVPIQNGSRWCSCLVTANNLISISAHNDLINNKLTPAASTSIVIKPLATAESTAPACRAATVGSGITTLSNGMNGWVTT